MLGAPLLQHPPGQGLGVPVRGNRAGPIALLPMQRHGQGSSFVFAAERSRRAS